MNKIKAFLSVGALALLFTSLSSAATISYNTSTAFPNQLTDFSGPLTFQQFDSSLGTLESVRLQLSTTLHTVLTVTNGAASASHGDANTELEIDVQDAGLHLNDLTSIGNTELDVFSPSFSYSLAPGGTVTSGSLSQSASSDDLYTLLAILNEFTGAGTISLNAATFTHTLLDNTGGGTVSSQVTNASLTGTVTYTYQTSETPEPATMFLMGSALLGIGLLRKRIKL